MIFLITLIIRIISYFFLAIAIPPIRLENIKRRKAGDPVWASCRGCDDEPPDPEPLEVGALPPVISSMVTLGPI